MIIQPGQLYPFVGASKRKEEEACDKTVSMILTMINYLKKGDSLEFDGIKLESLGNNLLYINSTFDERDVADDIIFETSEK